MGTPGNGPVIYRGEYLPEVTQFVARVYHGNTHFKFKEGVETLIAKLAEEDKRLASNSMVACYYGEEGELQSTARLVRRGGAVRRLPFEQEFGIDLDVFENSFGRIYECARLASIGGWGWIRSGHTFAEMWARMGVDFERDFIVAGLDSTVSRVLRRRWSIFTLGFDREYLGSITTPVGARLREFQLLLGNVTRGASTAGAFRELTV
jgi:hypothetical protein